MGRVVEALLRSTFFGGRATGARAEDRGARVEGREGGELEGVRESSLFPQRRMSAPISVERTHVMG